MHQASEVVKNIYTMFQILAWNSRRDKNDMSVTSIEGKLFSHGQYPAH